MTGRSADDFALLQANPAQEKKGRTPAQQKIDSQLLYAIYRKRGGAKAKSVPAGKLRVQYDEKGRVMVSVRSRVTKELLAKIEKLGGVIISSSEIYHDIRVNIALEKLEKIASWPDVSAIMPADEAINNVAH